jgi:hypothetical protein
METTFFLSKLYSRLTVTCLAGSLLWTPSYIFVHPPPPAFAFVCTFSCTSILLRRLHSVTPLGAEKNLSLIDGSQGDDSLDPRNQEKIRKTGRETKTKQVSISIIIRNLPRPCTRQCTCQSTRQCTRHSSATNRPVRRGASKGVEDGRRPPALRAGHPRNGCKEVQW